MSIIINNIMDPNDVGTISSGNLGLFAGPGELFYAKKSNGSYYPITSTVSGYNSSLIFNTFSYVLSITDGNSTQTASLSEIASGFYNAFLNISTSSNVLTLIDGYSTLTASLAYYAGGFNTSMNYNTASNVLSITDGKGTISATLSLTGANTNVTFNPFTNIIGVIDGFSTQTASLSFLSGNTSLKYDGTFLNLVDGRGSLTASLLDSKNGNLFITNISSTGSNNIILGATSGASMSSFSSGNIFIGANSGLLSASVSNNIFLGYNSGYFSTGNNNIYIGANTGPTISSSFDNSIAIGSGAIISTSSQFVLGSLTNPLGTSSTSGSSYGYLKVTLNGVDLKIPLYLT